LISTCDVATVLEHVSGKEDGYESRHVAYCFIFWITPRDERLLRTYMPHGQLRLKYKGTVRTLKYKGTMRRLKYKGTVRRFI